MTTKQPAKKTGDVEITEMTDIKAVRYDGVKSAASGYPVLLIKALDGPEPPADGLSGDGGASAHQGASKGVTEPPGDGRQESPLGGETDPAPDPSPDGDNTNKASGDEPVKESGSDELLKRIEALEADKAEAAAEAEKRYEALAEQLAKVLDTPVPGGPFITAPTATRKARDEEQRQIEASRMRRLAGEVDDPDLKTYYKERARALSGKEE